MFITLKRLKHLAILHVKMLTTFIVLEAKLQPSHSNLKFGRQLK